MSVTVSVSVCILVFESMSVADVIKLNYCSTVVLRTEFVVVVVVVVFVDVGVILVIYYAVAVAVPCY